MKRIMFSLLVAFTATTWLGCGGGESTTTTPAPSETAEPAEGDGASMPAVEADGENAATETVQVVTLSVPNMT